MTSEEFTAKTDVLRREAARANHWNKILKHLNYLDEGDLRELREEIDAILDTREE